MIGKCFAFVAVMCAGVSVVAGSDLYFSINDDANKCWDYAPGWKANKGTAGVLPTAEDSVTLNSAYLNVAAGRTPLAITNGVDAVVRTCWIGSMAQTDRRMLGLKIAGGTLDIAESSKWEALSIGHVEGGRGLLDLESGRVLTRYLMVGLNGEGVVTNRGGFIGLKDWNARMVVGAYAGGVGRYVQTDGALGCEPGDNVGGTALVAGHNGVGTIELSGGTVSNRVTLGTKTGGLGELFVSGGEVLGRVDIGAETNGTGRLTVSGGELHSVVNIGVRGRGYALFDAPYSLWADVRVGQQEGGFGIVTNTEPVTMKYSGKTLYLGVYGEGHWHAQANLDLAYVKVSGSTNATSTLTVYENATNSVAVQMNIGGAPYPPEMKDGASENFNVPGRGECILKGGAIRFSDPGYSKQNLFLGRTAEQFPGAFGILRGYGDVLPAGSGKTNVRMAIGGGQVIADGMGEERTLNLNAVVNVTNTVATGPDGTNGWYAVNKGRVFFPRTWYGSGTSFTRCFGDAPYATVPGLVNSLCFTIRQSAQNNNYFRGGAYAADRSDVHADELPPNDGIAGFWKLGVFSTLDDMGRRSFTDIDLTFRYDAAKVAGHRHLSLWRYENSCWVRVGKTVAEEGGIPRISTAKPLAPVSDSFNIGLFAVTADKAGLTILFR